MKHMKKIASFLLVLTLLLSLCVSASAASGTNSDNGEITIDNAVVGQTYTVYQILKLESYNTESKAYSYKATENWKAFVEGTDVAGKYLTTDDQDYVTWVSSYLTCEITDSDHTHSDACYKTNGDDDTAAFAKLAQAYAVENSIANQGTATATTTTVKFTGLNLGYYLVDTTLGALCSLDTTEPKVTIHEKNSAPTIEKDVKEGDNWGDTSYAKIGDTVEFKTTVHAKKGAQGYVIHDQMSEGLTLNQNSIEVKVGDKTLTKDTDYEVKFNVEHKNGETVESTCDVEIVFKQTYLDTITADTDIVVTYSAVLNDKAVISTDANTNKTKLDYGENPGTSTEWDETKTFTFKFEIIKTDSKDSIITGAKFELYDAATGGNKIALVKESDGSYRVATTEEKKADDFTSAVIEAGRVIVKGLDANTSYWLEEIEAPAGYNKLASRFEVKIENSNLVSTTPEETWTKGNGGVQITNQSGTELPSTGGMGTTIFYVVGAVLVLAAAVLLVTKKRMKANG